MCSHATLHVVTPYLVIILQDLQPLERNIEKHVCFSIITILRS